MEEEIEKAYLLIRKYEEEQRNELNMNIHNFRTLVKELISSTPTGDERNNYTHLNILFESILTSIF